MIDETPVSAEQAREVRMLLASKHECSPTLSRKGRELLDALEAELQAAQERLAYLEDEFLMLRDACAHCMAAGRPPNQQMIDNADEALAAQRTEDNK
jgi:hypothetical protein